MEETYNQIFGNEETSTDLCTSQRRNYYGSIFDSEIW